MEPAENEPAFDSKPKYIVTNIILVVLTVISIVCVFYSLGIAIGCIVIDVFTFLSIRSVRDSKENQELLPTYAFLVGGIAITLLNIGYLVTSNPEFHMSIFLLGLCFFLVGLALRVNRWELGRV